MRCRRRSSARGAATTASKAGRRCARGSTASPRTSASTCSTGRERRATPMDLGPSQAPEAANLNVLPETTWIQPIPDGLVTPDGDPAEVAVARETIRLAFVAALQHLPPRQRAVLILCEVLRWKAAEVAELLETSVASVNSALQRARATLEARQGQRHRSGAGPRRGRPRAARALRHGVRALRHRRADALIQEDATQSMPPFDLWLTGRDDILAWWFGPGHRMRRARASSRRWPPTARRRSASTSRARRARLRAVGAAGARDLRMAGSSR